jgi:hypothetical protein
MLPAWVRERIAEDPRRQREMISAIREGICDADPGRFYIWVSI